MPPDARVAGRDARRSSPPTTARPPAGCTQRPRSDIPCTTPHHRQGGDCGTRSDRLRAEPCRRWRSRRLLLPRLRDRVVEIRLRHAGEGLLLSLLQHTPDPVDAVAEARASASAQDAVTGASDQDLLRAETRWTAVRSFPANGSLFSAARWRAAHMPRRGAARPVPQYRLRLSARAWRFSSRLPPESSQLPVPPLTARPPVLPSWESPPS